MAGERPAAVILVLVSIATAQIFEPDVTRTQGCCNAVMLPYDGKAVIQSEREVRSQRYLGFRARFCNMDPFYLQAWELESEQKRTWTLKWQKLIEPPFIGVASIPLDFTYEASQRVGLQGVANRTRQLPVPYKFRPDSSYLLRSLEPAGGAKPGPFIPKQSYAFTEITWPLSFNEDMQFCFEKGCHDLLADLPGGIEGIPGPPGPPGPQGIAGPPGPPGIADKSSCDLNGQGEEISNDIKVLKSAVDGIAATLQGTTPSGICKEGYVKGSFGLPYCYKFFNIPLQMAEASMTCVDDGGRLADIETKEEFQFIASVIPFPPQSAGELTKMRYSYWLTSGIYSDDDGAWVWYDRGNAKITLPKDTWEGDIIPFPKASSKYLLSKICVVLARDIESGNVRLRQVACRVPRFYICKQYKKCS